MLDDRPTQRAETLEGLGWQARALKYHDGLGRITQTAAGRVVDAVGARAGMRLLDICCGPGYGAAEAVTRGVVTTGIDIAPAMITEATRNCAGGHFTVGDAEALPFPDATFDAAICAFGLSHLPRPERGIGEGFRVLRSGGRYAFTMWCSPEKAILWEIAIWAAAQHADLTLPLPSAPSWLELNDEASVVEALRRAGFRDLSTNQIAMEYRGSPHDDLLHFFENSTCWFSRVYRAQSLEIQTRIKSAVEHEALQYVDKGELVIPCPAVMYAGQKPVTE